MKTGKTLQQLAAELERQNDMKRDYIADTTQMSMTGDKRLEIQGLNQESPFGIMPHTHRQIASRLQIPQKYYDRMAEQAPELLARNVNTWFESNPEKRMVRTLDNTARAFLSNRYRRLDNWDLMQVALPALQEAQEINVVSSEITLTKVYLKAVFPRIEAEVGVGDPVQAGIVITNSEVGAGSLSVMPLMYRLVCLNGMISQDFGTKKYHVGAAVNFTDATELFQDETLKADDKALWMKLRDTVRAVASDMSAFHQIVDRAKEARGEKVDRPQKAVEVLGKTYDLGEREQENVLQHLIEGGDLSRWGMVNAVTRTSQDVDSYERASELEMLGGKVLDLEPSQWRTMAEAA